jgi:hypothetical protein
MGTSHGGKPRHVHKATASGHVELILPAQEVSSDVAWPRISMLPNSKVQRPGETRGFGWSIHVYPSGPSGLISVDRVDS